MVATCGAESCFSIPTSYVSDFVDTVRGALGPVYADARGGTTKSDPTPLRPGLSCDDQFRADSAWGLSLP